MTSPPNHFLNAALGIDAKTNDISSAASIDGLVDDATRAAPARRIMDNKDTDSVSQGTSSDNVRRPGAMNRMTPRATRLTVAGIGFLLVGGIAWALISRHRATMVPPSGGMAGMPATRSDTRMTPVPGVWREWREWM